MWSATAFARTGDAGGVDRDIPRSEIPKIRRQEQIAAGKALGVSDIHFLGYTDGDLQVTQDLRRDISRVIRQVKPQRVLIQSPERNWNRIYSAHPDHLAAGEAAIFSVYPDARNPFAHPSLLADENLDAWTASEVWVMGAPEVNHFEEVTEFIAQHKLAALRCPPLPDLHTWRTSDGRVRRVDVCFTATRSWLRS